MYLKSLSHIHPDTVWQDVVGKICGFRQDVVLSSPEAYMPVQDHTDKINLLAENFQLTKSNLN